MKYGSALSVALLLSTFSVQQASAQAASRRQSTAPASQNSAANLAAYVLDAGVRAVGADYVSPDRQELESRLAQLYKNSSKTADEAVCILMSFYLGEHNGEELDGNLLSRGPRMIPILEQSLRQEPAALLARYPERLRLERTTTAYILKEALEVLKVRAGARRISGASIETAPLQEKQTGTCEVKLLSRPELIFGDNLIQAGESYGVPVLRADIEENGDTTNVHFEAPSGIQRLDALLLTDVSQFKYAPRAGCGVVQANIVITLDWIAAR